MAAMNAQAPSPAMPKQWPLIQAAVVGGFLSVCVQVLLLRELIIFSCGNELVIGLILAIWLLAVATGCAAIGRLGAIQRTGAAGLSFSLFLVAGAAPFLVLWVRVLKPSLDLGPWDIPSLGQVLLASVIVLAPVCILLGVQFALATSLLSARRTGGASRAYVFEALGAAAGGVIVSRAFVFSQDQFVVALVLSVVGLISSSLVASTLPLSRASGLFPYALRRILVALPNLGLVAAILLLGSGYAADMAVSKLESRWGGANVVASADSVYGNVVVLERGGQTSFYHSGILVGASPAGRTAETIAHFAMLQHPHPDRVLLIGGVAAGLVPQLLMHDPESVTCVELDPKLIEVAMEHASESARSSLSDPRVSVVTQDGRLHVKTCQETFDVVIVSVPDPTSLQINRLLTEEFFTEVGRIMADGAVLAVPTTGSENYMSAEAAEFAACVDETLRAVFEDVFLVPGGTNLFLASNRHGELTVDPFVLTDRYISRGLTPDYVTPFDIELALERFRLAAFDEAIKSVGEAEKNTDSEPRSFLLALRVWSSFFGGEGSSLLAFGDKIRVWWFALPLAATIVLSRAFAVKRVSTRRFGAHLAIGISGLAGMALEIVLILGFQTIYGYVYGMIGLIIAAFMVAMAAGGWAGTRWGRDPSSAARRLVGLVIALALLLLAVGPLVRLLSGVESLFGIAVVANVVFPLVMLLGGFLVGAQFPLAVAIASRGADSAPRSAALLYGIDLVGAALGSVAAAILLVPTLGILHTCLALGILTLASVPLLAARA